MSEHLNADFALPVAINTHLIPWVASPQPGVERRMLDRVGGEVARATTIVRYAPGSRFPTHRHDGGEEYLVLEGVFSDEHGDYPAGTYVRNPPGSEHAPHSAAGCTIFVKLRQMAKDERERLVVPGAPEWVTRAGPEDRAVRVLFEGQAGRERVTIEHLAAGSAAVSLTLEHGQEILVLDGQLEVDGATWPLGSWIRQPAGTVTTLRAPGGATYWVKRGHL